MWTLFVYGEISHRRVACYAILARSVKTLRHNTHYYFYNAILWNAKFYKNVTVALQQNWLQFRTYLSRISLNTPSGQKMFQA
jgi:hypothetical protein